MRKREEQRETRKYEGRRGNYRSQAAFVFFFGKVRAQFLKPTCISINSTLHKPLQAPDLAKPKKKTESSDIRAKVSGVGGGERGSIPVDGGGVRAGRE